MYQRIKLKVIFQWAKIVLVVEQSVTTKERQKYQIKYSQPARDGRRAFPNKWYQSVSMAFVQEDDGGKTTALTFCFVFLSQAHL